MTIIFRGFTAESFPLWNPFYGQGLCLSKYLTRNKLKIFIPFYFYQLVVAQIIPVLFDSSCLCLKKPIAFGITKMLCRGNHWHLSFTHKVLQKEKWAFLSVLSFETKPWAVSFQNQIKHFDSDSGWYEVPASQLVPQYAAQHSHNIFIQEKTRKA